MRGAVLLALAAAATGALAVAPAGAARDASEPTIVALDDLEHELLDRLNALRRRHGLRPLRLSTPLALAADMHSRALARTGTLAHSVPGGPPFYRRVRRFYSAAGFRWWTVGENIAAASGPFSARDVLRMWLAAPDHRRNLLVRRWRHVGFGAIRVTGAPGAWAGAEVTIVTADFGARH